MPRTDFFHVQFEVPRVKSRQIFYKKILWKGLRFFFTFTFGICQDLKLQVALTCRKKPVLGQKKVANNFLDADHHFEQHYNFGNIRLK